MIEMEGRFSKEDITLSATMTPIPRRIEISMIRNPVGNGI